jgi:hypothetical protein
VIQEQLTFFGGGNMSRGSRNDLEREEITQRNPVSGISDGDSRWKFGDSNGDFSTWLSLIPVHRKFQYA